MCVFNAPDYFIIARRRRSERQGHLVLVSPYAVYRGRGALPTALHVLVYGSVAQIVYEGQLDRNVGAWQRAAYLVDVQIKPIVLNKVNRVEGCLGPRARTGDYLDPVRLG